MPTYHALDSYNPLLSLALGLLHMAGMMAVGHGLLRALRVALPLGWMAMMAIAVGVQVVGLTLILMAVAQVTTPLVLKATAAGLLIAGALYLALVWVPLLLVLWRGRGAGPSRWEWVWIGILVLGALPVIVSAVAPVSKADELRYHMLLADRVLLDGGFRFYPSPWPGAILPHMCFQLAGLPLHALGQPSAYAVSSAAIIGALFVFVYFLLRELDVPRVVALAGLGTILPGVAAPLWWASPASHAFGEVCGILAILLIAFRSRLLTTWHPVLWYGVLSVFAIGMANSKLSLLALAALVLLAGLCSLAVEATTRRWVGVALGLGFMVGVVLYVPWMAICHAYSGSPWGPVGAGKFGPSVYNVAVLQNDLIGASRKLNMNWNWRGELMSMAVQCWVLMALGFANAKVPLRDRALIGGLLIAQTVVILASVGTDSRFLGGIRYALMILSLPALGAWLLAQGERVRSWALGLGTAMIVPWVAGGLAYGSLFAKPVLGLVDARTFMTPLTYFLDDYAKLDVLLPPDATILTAQTWNNLTLYPRPVFMDVQDLPPDRPAYLLYAQELWPETVQSLGPYRMGAEVYHNPSGLHLAGRTRAPVYAPMTVVELVREP